MADPDAPRSPFAPWDRRELPGLFTVEESARRVGHYAWVEMRLFEALGGWVATVPELDVKTMLGRHCYHHAWHAELWVKRLPELREMRPERLIKAPNTDLEAFVAALTEPEAPDLTIEKLVGVYRVLLPRKIAAYTYFLTALGADAADADERWYGLILKDLHDGIRDGELLLQTLLQQGGDAAVQRAADHRAKLETLILEAGGIVGADSLGGATTSKETAR
jgi:hypothetical protein